MSLIDLNISKQTSLFLKGLAILIISLHNIIHKLPNLPIENEFSFSNKGAILFFTDSFFKEPFYFVLSFLGHYGVQIFIFLSAYAFYIKKKSIFNVSKKTFFRKRFFRISTALIIAIIAVSFLNVIIKLFIYDSIPIRTILNGFIGTYIGGFLHLLAIQPFLPKGTPGGLGPWWFISFIIQFYLLLPYLLKINYTKTKCIILIIVSIFINFIITKYKLVNFNIFYTVLGHFPEIIFAFYYAKFIRHKKVNFILLTLFFLISTLIVLYCNSNAYLWYFANIPSIFCLLSLFLLFQKIVPKRGTTFLLFIGRISVFIFLLNGITRDFFINYMSKSSKIVSIILILIYLIATISISYILYELEKIFKKKIFQIKYFKMLIS